MALWNDGRAMRWVGFPDGFGYDEDRWPHGGIACRPMRPADLPPGSCCWELRRWSP